MRFLLALLALLAVAGLAPAGHAFAAARLNSTVVVDGGTVTIGDLFANAGALADEPLLDAPAPGERIVLWSDEIQRLAAARGFDWTPTGPEKVVVERASRVVPYREIVERIADEIFAVSGGTRVEVELNNRRLELQVGLDEPDEFEVRHLSYDERSHRLSAILVPPSGDATGQRVKIAGRAFPLVEIPVLRRKLHGGGVIDESDVYWVEVRADGVTADTATDLDELVGLAARRTIRADRPVHLRDLEPPVLIAKGAPVTMIYRTSYMVLTMTGKAIDAGSAGASVRVLNVQSNKVIQAVVLDHNLVTVPSAPVIGFE